MARKPPAWESNPQVFEEIQRLYLFVKAPGSAIRLWEQAFTERERHRLGGDLKAIWTKVGTVGMWVKLHKVSPAIAVVELAYKLGLLHQTKYEWLKGAVGKTPKVAASSDVPRWDSKTGELHWHDRVIRRVRILSKPSNTQIILDAFQKQRWKGQIKNPLPYGAQQLHETLRWLNKSTKKISFHSQEGGKVISWKLR